MRDARSGGRRSPHGRRISRFSKARTAFAHLHLRGTGTARHWFCSVCGIYTHHRRRSNPAEFGVNLACLDGSSPFDLAEIEVVDGRNHPSDGGAGGIIGVLRFERRSP